MPHMSQVMDYLILTNSIWRDPTRLLSVQRDLKAGNTAHLPVTAEQPEPRTGWIHWVSWWVDRAGGRGSSAHMCIGSADRDSMLRVWRISRRSGTVRMRRPAVYTRP